VFYIVYSICRLLYYMLVIFLSCVSCSNLINELFSHFLNFLSFYLHPNRLQGAESWYTNTICI
jgi:hypothetical protein